MPNDIGVGRYIIGLGWVMTLSDPKPVKAVKVKKGMKRTNMRQKAPPPKSEPDKARSERVHNTPCMVCHKYHMEQLSRTAEHHWIMGRYSGAKSPNSETLPVCEGHHQGLRDTSKIAIHKNPDKWREEYGRDYDWLEYANDLIDEYNA